MSMAGSPGISRGFWGMSPLGFPRKRGGWVLPTLPLRNSKRKGFVSRRLQSHCPNPTSSRKGLSLKPWLTLFARNTDNRLALDQFAVLITLQVKFFMAGPTKDLRCHEGNRALPSKKSAACPDAGRCCRCRPAWPRILKNKAAARPQKRGNLLLAQWSHLPIDFCRTPDIKTKRKIAGYLPQGPA